MIFSGSTKIVRFWCEAFNGVKIFFQSKRGHRTELEIDRTHNKLLSRPSI